jgi:hypothetical protein
MVSILTLAALAALLALPAGTQPRKSSHMVFPRKVTLGPRTVLVQPRLQSDTCSVPLLNAMKPPDASRNRGMPAIAPRVNGTMRLVDPPAPPCEQWPPK